MPPVENVNRLFEVLLRGRDTRLKIKADTICEKSDEEYAVFKKDGQVVAKVIKSDLVAWHAKTAH